MKNDDSFLKEVSVDQFSVGLCDQNHKSNFILINLMFKCILTSFSISPSYSATLYIKRLIKSTFSSISLHKQPLLTSSLTGKAIIVKKSGSSPQRTANSIPLQSGGTRSFSLQAKSCLQYIPIISLSISNSQNQKDESDYFHYLLLKDSEIIYSKLHAINMGSQYFPQKLLYQDIIKSKESSLWKPFKQNFEQLSSFSKKIYSILFLPFISFGQAHKILIFQEFAKKCFKNFNCFSLSIVTIFFVGIQILDDLLWTYIRFFFYEFSFDFYQKLIDIQIVLLFSSNTNYCIFEVLIILKLMEKNLQHIKKIISSFILNSFDVCNTTYIFLKN